MKYMGIDIHKNSCHAVVEEEDGEEILSENFSNTRNGWNRLLSQISGDVKAVIEASGNWYPIFDRLEDEGYETVLAHPQKVEAIASAKIKTDKIDATTLADLLRADMIPEAYTPDKELRKVRELVRARIDIGEDIGRIKNRIHSLLDKNGIQHDFSDLFGKAGMEYLEQLNLPDHYRTILDTKLRILKSYRKEKEKLMDELAKIAIDDEKVKLLMQIPGISFYSALVIKSEIGDIDRFDNHKELASYAGLVPSTHQSGETEYQGSITKDGDSTLRWILTEVITHTVQKPGNIRSFYNRIKRRRGTKIARVAAARKLLRVIYCMISRNEDYRFEDESLTARKLRELETRAAN